jgi:hypothetical protein
MPVFRAVEAAVCDFEDVQVHTTKSQVAFRRKRGFAYIWMPGQYVRNATAAVVLSIALGHHDCSSRFKEVVHPTTKHWIHHLEIYDETDFDDQVVNWIREAAQRAG